MTNITSALPEWIKSPLIQTRNGVRAALYSGNSRYCPVCEKSFRQFRTGGAIPREDCACPNCDSTERHRFVWLYFQRMTDLFDGRAGKKMLHVAPERCFESRLRARVGNGYLTADLTRSLAMVKMDVTDIQYPEQSFDVIYCSHVLEHVGDDRKALAEFYRVLRQGGWAIILVPVSADETFEDPLITDPDERMKVYGHRDHLRNYGPDFVNRLQDAGFKVTVTRVNDMLDANEATRMGVITNAGEIFYCTK